MDESQLAFVTAQMNLWSNVYNTYIQKTSTHYAVLAADEALAEFKKRFKLTAINGE